MCGLGEKSGPGIRSASGRTSAGVACRLATVLLWGVARAAADDGTAAAVERCSTQTPVESIGWNSDLIRKLGYTTGRNQAAEARTALEAELEQLSREREFSAASRNFPGPEPNGTASAVATQRETLRRQIQELTSELARRPRPSTSQAESGTIEKKFAPQSKRSANKSPRNPGDRGAAVAADSAADPTIGLKQTPIDALALAQSLFRLGDHAGALQALESAQKTASDARDRVYIKYLTAVCLGKLNNEAESAKLFREVANSKPDDVLAECARWQLGVQQWREITAARIAKLRAAKSPGDPAGSGASAGPISRGAEPRRALLR